MAWTYGNGDGTRCTSCGKFISGKPESCSNAEHEVFYLRRKGMHKTNILKLRMDTILAYGGKCSCCGYANMGKKIRGTWVLQIDHVNGRKETDDLKGYHLYEFLKKLGYPEGYRILDIGCNAAMEYGKEKCELHGKSA